MTEPTDGSATGPTAETGAETGAAPAPGRDARGVVSDHDAPPAALARDDLRAAVTLGLVTEAQAAGLLALARARRSGRARAGPGDEPFEVFRGFDEVFVVVGLVVLAMGWVAALALASPDPAMLRHVGSGLPAWQFWAGAALIWALAEYFVRRRRMVGPAIALSLGFALNAAAAWGVAHANPIGLAEGDYDRLSTGLALAALAVAGFWARFRVPFALALVALGLMGAVLLRVATRDGVPASPTDALMLSSGGAFGATVLVMGLAVFAAAMAFDASDPHRVTRRAACGFWLHVVAAPAIVNPVALTLLAREGVAADLALVAVLGAMALVAVVIDRRSFLVAGAGYVVVLATRVAGDGGAGLVVLALGAGLLGLGAGWDRIRAAVLRPLAPVLPLGRLPPVA